jgi:hypothetical protein
MKKVLTIIPCLIGREHYTLRYLRLASLYSYQHDILLIYEKGISDIPLPENLKLSHVSVKNNIKGISDIFKSLEDYKEIILEYRYCHFVEDDNFIFPTSLPLLSDIMNSSEDYSAIVGNAFIYDKSNYKVLNNYRLPSFFSEKPSYRLRYYSLNGGITYYSLFRSEIFIEICSQASQISDNNICELAFNLIASIKCKINYSNTLFLAREYPRPEIYNIPNSLDWLISDKFSKDLKKLIDLLNMNLNLENEIYTNQELFDLSLARYFRSRFGENNLTLSKKIYNRMNTYFYINNQEVKRMFSYLRKYRGNMEF